jgi:hypothetical protein
MDTHAIFFVRLNEEMELGWPFERRFFAMIVIDTYTDDVYNMSMKK